MKKTALIILLTLCFTVVLSAKDIVRVYVSPHPGLHCETCEKKIRKALQFEKGMKDMRFDIENNRILLVFDQDKTSLEKLGEKLKSVGYEISIVSPDAKGHECHEDENNCGHSEKSSCLVIGKKR